jgi:hypothetical protein
MTLRELYNSVLVAIATRPEPEPGPPIEPIPSVLDFNANITESFAASSIGGDKTVDSNDNADEEEEEDQGDVVMELDKTNDAKGGTAKKVTFSKRPRRVQIAPPVTGNVTYRERLGGYLHPRDMR